LALQLAHRSVRKFLPHPVSDEHLAALVAAAQSASTSSNLQPWSVIAVRDPQRKARLAALANNQQFINEAPLFLIWVADLGRARRLAQRAGTQLDGADYLETTIIGFVDTALAAQNAVVAAESLGLGTVFVGALRNHPEEVAAELGLAPHTVATFGLAVGTPDVPGYDQRLADYNSRYGLPGNWSQRVLARLAGPQSLSGRHKLREQLTRLGLPSH
jgi:nitroreductase